MMNNINSISKTIWMVTAPFKVWNPVTEIYSFIFFIIIKQLTNILPGSITLWTAVQKLQHKWKIQNGLLCFLCLFFDIQWNEIPCIYFKILN